MAAATVSLGFALGCGTRSGSPSACFPMVLSVSDFSSLQEARLSAGSLKSCGGYRVHLSVSPGLWLPRGHACLLLCEHLEPR